MAKRDTHFSTTTARLTGSLALVLIAALANGACTQSTHVVGDAGGAGGRGPSASGSGGMSGAAGHGASGGGPAASGSGGLGHSASGGAAGAGVASESGGSGGRTSTAGATGKGGAGGASSGGVVGGGGISGSGGAGGAACPAAVPADSAFCDSSQNGLTCSYPGTPGVGCFESRTCACLVQGGVAGSCMWHPNNTMASCPATDAGVDASDGSSHASIDYTACDTGMDITRILVFRVDRTANTCIYMSFSQVSAGACGDGLASGGWCLRAAISSDVASCDKQAVPANTSAATAMTGTFAFTSQSGGPIYGMDVTLTFPIGGVQAGAPGTSIRILAQACTASCQTQQCDQGSYWQ